MNFKLTKDGYLVEKLKEGEYLHSTAQDIEFPEVDSEGTETIVHGILTRYFVGEGFYVVHKEEVSREVKVVETPSVESVLAESVAVVNLVTELRELATTLIAGLPLKNATQREYALTVALTDKTFTEKFLSLPEKFKETVIQ